MLSCPSPTRLGAGVGQASREETPTEAGQRLLDLAGSRFDEIEAELAALTALRSRPAGKFRITTGELALTSIVWPKLAPLLRDYPDIHVEFDVGYDLKDIVVCQGSNSYRQALGTAELRRKQKNYGAAKRIRTPDPRITKGISQVF